MPENDVSTLRVEIPLDELQARRYFHLKGYFDDFLSKVDGAGINVADYVAVVSVQKKAAAPLDRSAFSASQEKPV